MARILLLDAAGTPQGWISVHRALKKVCTGKVDGAFGSELIIEGAPNKHTGRRNAWRVPSIIQVGSSFFATRHYDWVPKPTKEALLARDRFLCAYCGVVQDERHLSVDHIRPISRGGSWVWENLVIACHSCNTRKRNRTPEEANMPLAYLPYRPTRHEHLILSNRTILADQMEFLMKRVPAHSRLKTSSAARAVQGALAGVSHAGGRSAGLSGHGHHGRHGKR